VLWLGVSEEVAMIVLYLLVLAVACGVIGYTVGRWL
jgi:hypothetical protein